MTLKLPWQRVAVLVGGLDRHPRQRDAVLQRAVGVLQRLRQCRRIGVGHIARGRTRGRAHQMNADDLGRSRTDGANQIAARQRKRHALAVMRMQLAVQRRRIHQHNRLEQVGRNVVAEVDNRRAALRQRPVLAVSSVRAVSRVIGRKRKPVLVNRQVGRRHHDSEQNPVATVTVSVEDEVSPSWSVIV